MEITPLGGLKFEVESRGIKTISDQAFPVGNNEGLTPVELMGSALGVCVAVYAAGYLERNSIPLEGFSVVLDFTMADKPKRVGAYELKVNVPQELTERQRASLSRIVTGCTVHNTLQHPPEIDIKLVTGS